MKKLLFLTLVIICALSFGVNAKDKSIIDEVWDNFLTTSDLDGETGKGELDFSVTVDGDRTISLANIIDPQSYGSYRLDASYDQVSDSTKFAVDLTQITNYMFIDGKAYPTRDLSVNGSVKNKFLSTKWLELAGGAYGSFKKGTEDGASFGATFYSDLALTRGITLYNALDLNSHYAPFIIAVYNGAELEINGNHSLKFRRFKRIITRQSYITAAYRGKITDGLTYLVVLNKDLWANTVYTANYLEGKITPSLTVTGVVRYGNDGYFPNIGLVDAKQKLGRFTIGGAYQWYFLNKFDVGHDLAMAVKVDLTKSLKLSIDGHQVTTILPQTTRTDKLIFKVGITQEL